MIRPNSPAGTGADEHAWAQSRLIAAVAGLLIDADEDRLRAHLAGCAECAEQWRARGAALAAESDNEGRRHLPAAMIARWKDASSGLRGMERDVVRRHLEHCAECRADLAELGQATGLEQSRKPALASLSEVGSGSPRSFRSGFCWGTGVVALAAMLAGLALWPGAASDPLGNAVMPWVAPVNLRGQGPVVLEIQPGVAGFTVLAAVPGDIDRGRSAHVSVIAPDGERVVATEVAPQLLAARTVAILVTRPADNLDGFYSIEFRQTLADGREVAADSRFEVRMVPAASR